MRVVVVIVELKVDNQFLNLDFSSLFWPQYLLRA